MTKRPMHPIRTTRIQRIAIPAALTLTLAALAAARPGPAGTSAAPDGVVAVHIAGLQMIGPEQALILLADEAERLAVPIAVGRDQGVAIYLGKEGMPTPRPMTHDLMARILKTLEVSVTKITITELRDDTYFAEIALSWSGGHHTIDARPSDAIALAVRLDVPMFAASDLMRPVGEQGPSTDDLARLDARLGLAVQNLDADLAEFLGAKGVAGVLIASVEPEGPAGRAGLKRGDILKAIDDRPTDSLDRYEGALREARKQPRFRIWRDGQDLLLREE